jgi:hypothetical protein
MSRWVHCNKTKVNPLCATFKRPPAGVGDPDASYLDVPTAAPHDLAVRKVFQSGAVEARDEAESDNITAASEHDGNWPGCRPPQACRRQRHLHLIQLR